MSKSIRVGQNFVFGDYDLLNLFRSCWLIKLNNYVFKSFGKTDPCQIGS